MNKISDDLLLRLLKQASLGKLIGGLIHNINGPMQNLGLDIEMSNLLLKKNFSENEDLLENIKKRLARMGEEFNRIDLLIRSASIKADPDSDYYSFLDFNEFLERELDFLAANLYFKHNIRKNIELDPEAPKTADLPKNFYIALSWFIQAVIEELETREAEELSIRCYTKDLQLRINLQIKKGSLSDKFLDLIRSFSSDSERSGKPYDYFIITPILEIFKTLGASIRIISESGRTEIQISIPLIL